MPNRKELKHYAVELVVEFFATAVLIFIGEAGIANYKFGRQPSQANFAVSITFGVGVYAGKITTNDLLRSSVEMQYSILLEL